MLANEPDKCILYLYHLHKIAQLASWIFNGTINIFNPFKSCNEAGNWTILTKLSPAKRHQAAHQPHPFVHNWEERQHSLTLPPPKPSSLPGVKRTKLIPRISGYYTHLMQGREQSQK